jgi:uncharacterized protein YqjF (DUF2071 family)
MHWPVPAAALRPLVLPGLDLDTFAGEAWLGVVPFRMTGIRHRLGPALPWVSAFAELNVRTYVTAGGRPGVWFFSLDAANPLAVRVARWQFRLPYFDARMAAAADGADGVRYASERTHRGAPPAGFAARYRPTGPAYRSDAGTLEHWLTERYCLYAADARGRVFRGEVEHAPWPLQPAEAEVERNTMGDQIGVRLPDAAPPLLHFARRVDVVAWGLQPA